jgi:cell division protein FtsL
LKEQLYDVKKRIAEFEKTIELQTKEHKHLKIVTDFLARENVEFRKKFAEVE